MVEWEKLHLFLDIGQENLRRDISLQVLFSVSFNVVLLKFIFNVIFKKIYFDNRIIKPPKINNNFYKFQKLKEKEESLFLKLKIIVIYRA
jgi:hypothetical protein